MCVGVRGRGDSLTHGDSCKRRITEESQAWNRDVAGGRQSHKKPAPHRGRVVHVACTLRVSSAVVKESTGAAVAIVPHAQACGPRVRRGCTQQPTRCTRCSRTRPLRLPTRRDWIDGRALGDDHLRRDE